MHAVVPAVLKFPYRRLEAQRCPWFHPVFTVLDP